MKITRTVVLVLCLISLSSLAYGAANIGGCQIFPSDSIYNTPIDTLPVDAKSATYINAMSPNIGVHPDFGAGMWNNSNIGMPYNLVRSTTPRKTVSFYYPDESDPGPYPIPDNPLIEGQPNATGDRHIIMIDIDNCIEYDLYDSHQAADGSWNAGSGAIFDLKTNGPLRTAGWTSANAAGTPILAGLVTYEEFAAGSINHVIAMTTGWSQNMYLWPARHYAGGSDTSYPPMGQHFRLKASFDSTSLPAYVQPIVTALKKYGAMVVDNGVSFFISGVHDDRWDNDQLAYLGYVKASDFEAVDVSSLTTDPNSAQAKQNGGTTTDSEAPRVTAFALPATSSSQTVPITTFIATDNVGVTGYIVSETPTKPSPSAAWNKTAPTTYTFPTTGSKTLYAFAKDAAGNVSDAALAKTTVSTGSGGTADTSSPVITTFSLPETSTSLTASVTLTAKDNVSVAGYLLTESPQAPTKKSKGWQTKKPGTYTFSSRGTHTLYAYVRDAAGNISAAASAQTTISIANGGHGGSRYGRR